jgi:hypothetical protein
MPRFTFTEVSPGVFKVTKAEVIPLHMWLGPTKRLYDIPAAMANPKTSRTIKNSCLASLKRIKSVIGQRGAFADGLVLVGANLL